MNLNLDQFERRIESGHIRKQTLGNLTIWNYTHKTQFERAWDEYTILARGIITEPDGRVHSRSFRKFFNLGEPGVVLPPNETPEITLKEDGYLGLTYWQDGIVKVASRGSFQSEYARWATEWLRVNIPDCDRRFDPAYTYVFEILYPHKRIVVDNSGRYGLVLLAMVHNDSGIEPDRAFMLDCMYRNGEACIPIVKAFKAHTVEECAKLAKTLKGQDCEGFIAHYRNSGLRVKIKGDDYCRIHRVATRLNSRTVWQILTGWENGKINPPGNYDADLKIDELVSILAPEYGVWVRKVAEDLRVQHDEIAKDVARVALRMHLLNIADRKSQVEYARRENPKLFHLIMSFLDFNGRWDEMAWKMVEPKAEPPILRDGEDE